MRWTILASVLLILLPGLSLAATVDTNWSTVKSLYYESSGETQEVIVPDGDSESFLLFYWGIGGGEDPDRHQYPCCPEWHMCVMNCSLFHTPGTEEYWWCVRECSPLCHGCYHSEFPQFP